jgi:DNA-binding transcriptional ArsR family regulator
MDVSQLDQAFPALADRTRRGILVHLASGEASVSELVSKLSFTLPTISWSEPVT